MANGLEWVEREQGVSVVLWCVRWTQCNLMKIVWWVWVFHTSSANTQWWKRPSCGPVGERGGGGGVCGGCWQIFVVLPHSWQWRLWHCWWTVAHLPCCMSSVNFVLGGVSMLYKLTLTMFSMYCATCKKGVHKTHTHTHTASVAGTPLVYFTTFFHLRPRPSHPLN